MPTTRPSWGALGLPWVDQTNAFVLPDLLLVWFIGACVALALCAGEQTSQLTKLPVLRRYVEAPYPPKALAEGREGTVVLGIDVDAQGRVEHVEVIVSAGPEFDEAALEAARKFEFEPAEAGELGPVPVRITYRYAFVLKESGLGKVRTASTATRTQGSDSQARVREIVARWGAAALVGRIREAGTRKPIPFATIEAIGSSVRTSTETNAEGLFRLHDLPPGRYHLSIRVPLFGDLDVEEELLKNEELEVLYFLNRIARDPYEVVVRAKIPKREVARRTLRFEEIERLPGTQGDAIRVVQNLPGVARSPYGIGLLIVRGAPPQDTGVFLDGHRMPILFHFGGIGGVTSVVNSRMLEAIDFYPGGFGPEQGRVSAGAVELRSRLAETDRVHGEATVDLAGASVFLEGPVTDRAEDGAFVIALRRSYIDGVIAGLTSLTNASVSIAPRYYDYQIRYDRPLGEHQTFILFVYGSDDEFVILGNDLSFDGGGPEGTRSRTFFHRINPRFIYRPNEDAFFSLSPIFGVDYSNARTSGDAAGSGIRLLLRDVNAGLRVDGLTRILPWAKLRAGGDALWFLFANDSEIPALPAVRDFPGPIATDTPTRKDSAVIPAVLASLYGEFELVLADRLTLWPGLRADFYHFRARPGPLLDPRLIEGRNIFGVDPRITGRYRLSDPLSLKAQAGIYRQPPLPPQFYVNADLPLQTVDQYAAGFEWQIFRELSLDLQGFLRFGSELPRATGETEVVDGKLRPVGFRANGESRAYGTEVLLKLDKTWGLFGWIAYTLSRSEVRREGEEFVSNFFFDQTHNLNLLASYELGLSWFLSLRLRYVTGGGLPATSARWYDADRDGYSRSTSGQRRAPAFHQLDLRIDKRWVFNEWVFEAYLDVQNVYNYTNTEFYAPSFDFKNEVPIPSLPIFPLVGFKGIF